MVTGWNSFFTFGEKNEFQFNREFNDLSVMLGFSYINLAGFKKRREQSHKGNTAFLSLSFFFFNIGVKSQNGENRFGGFILFF